MDRSTSLACAEIDDNSAKIYDLSHKIWALAEPGGKEEASCKLVVQFLRKRRFKITTKFMGRPTAFSAEFGKCNHGVLKRMSVVIICHYDAIKGKGHIYGNNLSTAVAVAAAIGIQNAIESDIYSILGKVTVIGCPNSQNGWLLRMVNEGAFHEFDLCLNAVPGSRAEWSPHTLGTKTIKATYKHTRTDMCGNELSTQGEKFLISPQNAALLSLANVNVIQEHWGNAAWQVKAIIAHGGGADPTHCDPVPNSETLMKMVAPSDAELRLLETRVLPCLDSAAEASGCGVDVSVGGDTLCSFISSPSLVEHLRSSAYYCGMMDTPLKPTELFQPIAVASVSQMMPTLRPMFYIGCDEKIGTHKFKDACATHRAHAYTMSMAKAFAITAIEAMRTPRLLETAAQEMRAEKTRQKKVKFEPFPKGLPRRYNLPKNVPVECNKGWSKR